MPGWATGSRSSAVGHDEPGDAALGELAARDMDATFIARVDQPTGVAHVRLGDAFTCALPPRVRVYDAVGAGDAFPATGS